jgi:hypothetical protein
MKTAVLQKKIFQVVSCDWLQKRLTESFKHEDNRAFLKCGRDVKRVLGRILLL